MEYNIYEQVDLEEEIVEYLTEKHNPELFDTYKAYKEADSDLKRYYKIGVDVKKLLDKVPFEITPISKMLFQMDKDDSTNLATVLKYTEGHRYLLTDSILNHYDIEEELESEEAVRSWVYQSNFSIKIKYDIASLFLDFDKFYQELQEMIECYYDQEVKLNQLLEPFMDSYLLTAGDEQNIVPLNKELGFDLSSAHSIKVFPFLGQPTRYKGQARLNEEHDKGINYIFYVGVSVMDVLQIRNSHENIERRVQKLLKFMGEKTKYDILKLCLDKKHYGGELAAALDLSGATVSHHVNELAEEQLLTMAIDKNRVYYSTNSKTINDVLHEAIKLFEEK